MTVEDPATLDSSVGIVRDTTAVPFPSVDNVLTQSTAERTSHGSFQSSSDKLSALPTSKSNPNTNRLRRSPLLSPTHILPNRVYRRSLDAASSLPSFSNVDPSSAPSTWRGGRAPGAGSLPHTTVSDGFLNKDAQKQRVSFESERATPNTRQAFFRVGSDSGVHSPGMYGPTIHRDSPLPTKESEPQSRSPSHSRSRATSPLRNIFQNWTHHRTRRGHIPEEPFIPIDPFKLKTQFRLPFISSGTSLHSFDTSDTPDGDVCAPPSGLMRTWDNTRIFVIDTLPRVVYLHMLLRLPAMYFTRVAKIFQDAEVSRPDIQRMIESGGGGSAFLIAPASAAVPLATLDSNHGHPTLGREAPGSMSPNVAAGIGLSAHVGAAAGAATSTTQIPLPFPDEWTPPLVSPALVRFKYSWEAFVDSLLKEWKTLNVVSALLLSAILTTFQVPNMEADPAVRIPALISLVCALMSLSYGCMFIVRFGTMKSMFRASRWAEEARKTKTAIFWNVWVLLAMPFVWIAWSMVAFVTAILAFVWRTGSITDPAEPVPLGPKGALAGRVVITSIFALGIVYFVLIVRTLRGYGGAGPPTKGFNNTEQIRPGAAQTTGTAPGTRGRARARDRDVELELALAMERRGRERQRSGSRSVRKREEARTVGRNLSREEVAGEKSGSSPSGGPLRALLGLGLVGLHDLEKGNASPGTGSGSVDKVVQ